MTPLRALLLAVPLFAALAPAAAQPDPGFTRTEDVIYGRKFGTALTMDVFTPKAKANGAGVIWCVSGGWYSNHDSVNVGFAKPYLDRGYTVFQVVHGSQPRFSIPEVLDDMHRAVRFVRANAGKYGIDKDRLGISGASAGGHLSLMQGVAPRPGNPLTKDKVDLESSKVAAVACFFPPTDFLNYGKTGNVALGDGTLKGFRAPFNFVEFDDATKAYVVITDEEKRRRIGKQISPAYHATKDSAPALIIHGDKDTLVPIQQAEVMVAAYKQAGATAELVVKPGAAHGWGDIGKDIEKCVDWFDTHLAKQ
ncbi:alpha/beta hydrolase [Urbifossiella limnaea]|uniref:Prolyl oligopeptidase family protein n=1 Tax=Urbifossiella limnaea TaxID=2528023 RepID=A0A517XMG4_9BACT|nr:alpha/beta hydrolase [Urbifossiella limnaea]QDU18708.1 Prolyl oligopeptidase family protein [Urbifossiella limnaea]